MFKRIESGTCGWLLGVDYLSQVKEKADQFKINGIVSIQEDGSIKVIAEGQEKDLGKFVKKLKKGRLFSHIENFYVKWFESEKEFSNFYIN